MKKIIFPIISAATVFTASLAVLQQQIHQPSATLADTLAARCGSWLYATFPARPELLVPLAVLTALITLAALAAHHLTEDSRLNDLQDLGNRKIRTVRRQPRVRRTPVSARLIPTRAI